MEGPVRTPGLRGNQMKLYTECHWDGWDRIVDIYTENCDRFPEYINDRSTYKIIVLEQGVLELISGSEKYETKAPALILLNQNDVFDCRIIQDFKARIIYFKPSVIREEFSTGRIDSGEFDNAFGQSIFQDYMLVRYFTYYQDIASKIFPLALNDLARIKELYNCMENELLSQRDGFWPCRSRSYIIEILHFITYSFIVTAPEDTSSADQEDFSKICSYLNEHISDQITLEILTKQFAVNRNKLNDLFMKQSSMTCLNYLLNLRMDLAKILLTKTELPISEIGARVGFPDPNYFAKIFRRETGVTPSRFRAS